jgi:hypothetical protein
VSVRPRSTKLQESHQFAASAVDQRSRHLKPSLLRPFRCFGLLVLTPETKSRVVSRFAEHQTGSREVSVLFEKWANLSPPWSTSLADMTSHLTPCRYERLHVRHLEKSTLYVLRTHAACLMACLRRTRYYIMFFMLLRAAGGWMVRGSRKNHAPDENLHVVEVNDTRSFGRYHARKCDKLTDSKWEVIWRGFNPKGGTWVPGVSTKRYDLVASQLETVQRGCRKVLFMRTTHDVCISIHLEISPPDSHVNTYQLGYI